MFHFFVILCIPGEYTHTTTFTNYCMYKIFKEPFDLIIDASNIVVIFTESIK